MPSKLRPEAFLQSLRIKLLRLFRTLRFRLAAAFLSLLTLVLVIVGVVGTTTLKNLLDSQSEQTLRDELGTMKGYIYFNHGNPEWFVDKTDPEEAATLAKLQDIFIISKSNGDIWQATTDPAFEDIVQRDAIRADATALRHMQEPDIRTITGKDGNPYQIISSLKSDDYRHEWYILVGHSLTPDRTLLRTFRRNYTLFFPIALLLCMIVSWYSAGKALTALQSVQKAAQNITGNNLGLQIPKRGADDELDRLIGSFNEMSRRLKSSFEQMRQFSTDVSHELRTPLTAIQGQLEVALFTATQPEQLREAIENALQDVERLSNLVRALLLLSQSETGQVPMNKGVVDLSSLVSEIVDQFQIPAEAHEVKLTYGGSGPCLCEIDQTQLERVITNLLSNSLKYTPAGGWIEARAESDGSNVKLVVKDSGVGIPADHLPHIFNRFYRVPDPNPEKGLGLGLSFVSSIVKAHSGEIHVTSEVGTGSTFEVVLPVGTVPLPTESQLLEA